METTSNTGAGTNDQPPDPAAAKAAAREARRRQEISSWPVYLAVAALTGVLGIGCLLYLDREIIPLTAFIGFVSVFIALCLAWPLVGRRLGAKASGYARESTTTVTRAGQIVQRRLALGIVPVILVVLAHLQVVPGRQALSLVVAYLACFLVWRAFSLRLWEFGWAAAVLAALSPLIWLSREGFGLRLGCIFVALSLANLPVGLGYLVRWRRWGSSLPPESQNAGVPEAKP